MTDTDSRECIAFIGDRCIAGGSVRLVVAEILDLLGPDELANVLVFDSSDGRVVDLDLRGSRAEILSRLPEPAPAPDEPDQPKKRGRPRLGVVAREVTLLPRHWEWLNSQPGGASVALRRLVEAARRESSHRDKARLAQESCYRFMSAMAGNLPHFEEAARALFAGEAEIFRTEIAAWPADVRRYAEKLALDAFINPRAACRTKGEEG